MMVMNYLKTSTNLLRHRPPRWPARDSWRLPDIGMSLAQAAHRAIQLGGVYDGHELPKDINKFTAASATALAGQGLVAVARYRHEPGAGRSSRDPARWRL